MGYLRTPRDLNYAIWTQLNTNKWSHQQDYLLDWGGQIQTGYSSPEFSWSVHIIGICLCWPISVHLSSSLLLALGPLHPSRKLIRASTFFLKCIHIDDTEPALKYSRRSHTPPLARPAQAEPLQWDLSVICVVTNAACLNLRVCGCGCGFFFFFFALTGRL